MVAPGEIDSPEECADVLEDVRSECLRHGAVLSINLSAATGGKIYVEFATAQQAQGAALALTGRKYNGRVVGTVFCDARRYAAGELQ